VYVWQQRALHRLCVCVFENISVQVVILKHCCKNLILIVNHSIQILVGLL
jgi:hypothetical protein